MSGIGNSAAALGANVAAALYGVTGSGVTIGIISDSYDVLGGAATNVAAGYLPAQVTVLQDDASGTDEGQAMMELAYQIAPGASYDFCAAGDSLASCAAAVAALQAAGCTIIVDDVSFPTEESFYQTGTVLDQAITAAVAAGTSFFSAAGNSGNNYVQQGFVPLTATIPGINAQPIVVNNFGGTGAYQPLSIAMGQTLWLEFQWAQSFETIGTGSAGAQDSFAIYLLNASGTVVASATTDELGGNPQQGLVFTNDTGSGSFRLVVVENGGSAPAGQLLTLTVLTSGATLEGSDVGQGSGSVAGHQLLAVGNTVGAVTYSDTPAFGVSPAVAAAYSSTGPGVILYDANGNPLLSAESASEPDILSVAGSSTTVAGFGTFSGTSAAAPNAGAVAALMLQANAALTPAEVTALLEQSVIPVSATSADAGLIQARAAVELSVAAAGTNWSHAAGGDWSVANNWSTGLTPTAAGAVMLSNDLGSLTGSYGVTVDTGGDTTGSLTVSAPAGSTVTLTIATGGALAVGGLATANITAGDFLVGGGGTVMLAGGSLSVTGSLNVNDGTVVIDDGMVTADNYAQDAGQVAVGGAGSQGTIALTGALGIAQTGGTMTIGAGGMVETTAASFSASTVAIDDPGAMLEASSATKFSGVTLTEDGILDTGALSFYGGSATIAQTGSVSASALTVGMLVLPTQTSVATVSLAGSLDDTGALGTGTTAIGGTISIAATGTLTIGGATAGAAISFADGGGLVDFCSTDNAVLTGQLNAVISGFGDGSSIIEFGALTYAAADDCEYANGILSIEDGSDTLAAVTLDPTASYGGFSLAAGAADQLDILALACFAAGTRLLTGRGPVAVESLRVGDRVVTTEGGTEPVIWIGSRRVDCRRHAHPSMVRPVRLRAHSFGPQRPSRNVYLSPDHALLLEGVLIPVKHLIDGASIAQVEAESVTYFHVELPRHAVLFAEGLPAESYLDTGDRGGFSEAPAVALHPYWGEETAQAALVRDALGCAPLCVTGLEVDRARARLARISREGRATRG